MSIHEVTYSKVSEEVCRITRAIWGGVGGDLHGPLPDMILGISRGGIIPATLVTEELGESGIGVPLKVVDPFTCDWMIGLVLKGPLVFVDDIEDSSATMNYFRNECFKRDIPAQFYTLVKKTEKEKAEGVWYKFPWETGCDTPGGMEQAVVALLRGMGENPERKDLKDTPRRVAKMWDELTAGYQCDPSAILSTTFSKENYDEMIVVKDIKFFSTCEHHLAPFYGVAHFAYIPDKSVVGLSKVHRLVEAFARRLQIQERMTMEIGKTFEKIVNPKGVALVIEATHLCTMMRGVKKENSKMVTSYLGGAFRDELSTRQEFLSIIKER